jgi:uncharacterized membrane protein
MNEYLIIKWLHILSSTVLFGTGIGIAFFKWITDRSGDIRAIRVINERTVFADWLFTTPSGIVQLATGVYLAYVAGYPLLSGWVFYFLCLFVLAGGCWLPVLWLQIQMQEMARTADATHISLPAQYWVYTRVWFWLGVPAFFALVVVYGLMVFKPAI